MNKSPTNISTNLKSIEWIENVKNTPSEDVWLILDSLYMDPRRYMLTSSDEEEKTPQGWTFDTELHVAIHPEFLQVFPLIYRKMPLSDYKRNTILLALKYALPEVIQNFRKELDRYKENVITKEELQLIMKNWVYLIDKDQKKYSELINVIQGAKLALDIFDTPQNYPYMFNQKEFDPLSDLPANEIVAIKEMARKIKIGLNRGGEFEVKEWHVVKIQLYQEGLTSIPKDIGQLTMLQKLDLHDNNLSSIPKEIAQLTLLQDLDVSDNHIKVFPPAIRSLKRLKKLNMFGNDIETIPDWIGELSELEELNLSDTQICALPESFGNLSHLEHFSLMLGEGESEFKYPDSIVQLTNLESFETDQFNSKIMTQLLINKGAFIKGIGRYWENKYENNLVKNTNDL